MSTAVLLTRFTTSLLLLAAITQKSYQLNGTAPAGDGAAAFFMGWGGVLYGGAALCWLANPALIAALLLIQRNPVIALICNVAALALALGFLAFDKIIANEAGHYARITGYRAGYWLWISSMAAGLSGNLICFLNQE